MALLIPETGLLFWMTICFGIVFFILYKYGFPIITKSVEDRNNHIYESLKAAEEATTRLAEINIEADGVLQQAYQDRKEIMNQAISLKKKIESEARESAEKEIIVRINKANLEIEEMKRKATEDIKNLVVDVSVKIAGKVLESELDNTEKQRKLVDRLFEEEMSVN